jgi:hypothetical protein
VTDVSAETVLVMRRREVGGMMSFKAEIRSYSVSFSTSRTESVEISDSDLNVSSMLSPLDEKGPVLPVCCRG